VKGKGGQFEISLDGNLIFSKKQLGRFPETREVLEKIPA
jgi:selT/selW/selH-like putative selenoprotein